MLAAATGFGFGKGIPRCRGGAGRAASHSSPSVVILGQQRVGGRRKAGKIVVWVHGEPGSSTSPSGDAEAGQVGKETPQGAGIGITCEIKTFSFFPHSFLLLPRPEIMKTHSLQFQTVSGISVG